ncbi:uncharacterized protein [Triticum aestivum]|uniref:uncharacterized protein n=1 Tax=Triticum aestivum TaxID=4565 RepID=UPI0001BA8A8D|nr:uncharacterized protein LOC123103208 [Triticum aestivum]
MASRIGRRQRLPPRCHPSPTPSSRDRIHNDAIASSDDASSCGCRNFRGHGSLHGQRVREHTHTPQLSRMREPPQPARTREPCSEFCWGEKQVQRGWGLYNNQLQGEDIIVMLIMEDGYFFELLLSIGTL